MITASSQAQAKPLRMVIRCRASREEHSTTAFKSASHCTNTLATASSLIQERALRCGAMAMTRATISATTMSANKVGRLQNCGSQ